MSGEEGIRVFVRVRPQNKKEQQLNRSAVEVSPLAIGCEICETNL